MPVEPSDDAERRIELAELADEDARASVLAEASALEALANAASPGPWRADECLLLDREGYTLLVSDFGHHAADVAREEDARFIAAARQAVPALVARVRELESASGDGAPLPDLDRLEALANAASPGPWTTNGEGLWDGRGESMLSSEFQSSVGELPIRDAAFLAAAREAVPLLVARVRRLVAG